MFKLRFKADDFGIKRMTVKIVIAGILFSAFAATVILYFMQ